MFCSLTGKELTFYYAGKVNLDPAQDTAPLSRQKQGDSMSNILCCTSAEKKQKKKKKKKRVGMKISQSLIIQYPLKVS